MDAAEVLTAVDLDDDGRSDRGRGFAVPEEELPAIALEGNLEQFVASVGQHGDERQERTARTVTWVSDATSVFGNTAHAEILLAATADQLVRFVLLKLVEVAHQRFLHRLRG